MIGVRKRRKMFTGLIELCEYVQLDNIVMVEIGSYVGESTMVFANSPKIRTIHCIDPWLNGYDDNDGASKKHPMCEVEAQFDETIKATDKVIKHKMTSEQAAQLFKDGIFDLVYIDGCHTYESVKQDITLWLPKIKPTGYISGHDWNVRRHDSVNKAVTETLGQPHQTFRDQSWIKKL